MSKLGTPSTLREAISRSTRPNIAYANVRDYLSQVFTVAMLSELKPGDIWKLIFKESPDWDVNLLIKTLENHPEVLSVQVKRKRSKYGSGKEAI